MSQMFFKGEVEQEVRESCRDFKFKSDCDIKDVMCHIEDSRVAVLYPHCQSELCIGKG